ncbi:quaternary ammonium compound-resistance protein SugE [Pseudarcicella hirudinis]|uniref:Quaternary ammonium compound-resistance protein SugE n=1 Tax=Pseudarcicella hirudinis TaxID=1079859 RepID=A0A1I5Z093_9BACT|nr:SMR family transporter [Pseudarcicella hirudinis]SFQ49924.1 quaternary ammonium compound-resistance protein SugE [Pseudarcicella hirudinis]
MHWVYIFIAALFEAAWTFSLKFLKLSEIKQLRFDNFYKPDEGLQILLPLLGYILFGIGNIYFFSLAMKHMSIASAFAVWTAMSIILIKVAEMLFYGQKITLIEIFFMSLITVGIVGLKVYAQAK